MFNFVCTSFGGMLSIDCLIVKIGWRDDDKDWRRLFFTIIPIVFALTISIIPLPGKNYNYNGAFFCDTTASPLGCDYPDSTTPCTRGANARVMLLYVGVVPFMVVFAIIISAMSILVYSVLKQERRMDRYRQNGEGVDRSMTQQASRQGLYYIAAFGICWIPWYICKCFYSSQLFCALLGGYLNVSATMAVGKKKQQQSTFAICNSNGYDTRDTIHIFGGIIFIHAKYNGSGTAKHYTLSNILLPNVLLIDAIIEYQRGEIPELLGFIHLTTMPLQGVVSVNTQIVLYDILAR